MTWILDVLQLCWWTKCGWWR